VRKIFFSRGQNLVDLALVIGVVGLVLTGMEVYIRRSVQGKVRDVTDHIISGSQSAGDAVDQTSTLNVDSSMTAQEFPGGGRKYVGDEHSVYDYNIPPH
jgi:hypothetical protein